MSETMPSGEQDDRFSSPGGAPIVWSAVEQCLTDADVFWLTTVRRDGRPHVTPLVGTWLDKGFYFCTGDDEQKAVNLRDNPNCAVTTGSKSLQGLDVVVEGRARVVRDTDTLERVAGRYRAKYLEPFQFSAGDGAPIGAEGNRAPLYRVEPTRVLAFGKGESFSQTRWRF